MAKQSNWNLIAPLISGILIVLIVFAWVWNKKREDDFKAQEEKNRQIELAAEEARKKAKADERAERERLAKERLAQRLKELEEKKKSQLWNWVRQKEVVVAQSSTREPYNALLAADGIKDGALKNGGVIFALPTLDREKKTKDPAWWRADLGKERRISEIILYNCTDPELEKRLSNFRITILNKDKKNVYDKVFLTKPGEYVSKSLKILMDEPISGRWVRVKLNGPNALGDGALHIAEIEILGPQSDDE